MALTSTIYVFTVQLADIDRGVYQDFELRMARHPSETAEYLLTRLLAYCLEWQEGIALTEGIAAADEPAVLVRDLTGRVTAWIEVGAPDAERLHKGSKLAGYAAVYTHRDVNQWLPTLSGKKIHRAEELRIRAFDKNFVQEAAAALERRCSISISVTEGQLYLNVNGKDYSCQIAEHRLA